jgi:hypothetical protein
MYKKEVQFSIRAGVYGIVCVALGACAGMTTLSESKLQETAGAVIGKPVTSVTNVRSVGDMQYYDAKAGDGSTYACSLQVLFGVTSQKQKCDKK